MIYLDNNATTKLDPRVLGIAGIGKAAELARLEMKQRMVHQ